MMLPDYCTKTHLYYPESDKTGSYLMQKASSGFPSRVLRLTSGQTTLHFTKITANYLQMCSTVNTLETTFDSVIDVFIFSDIG